MAELTDEPTIRETGPRALRRRAAQAVAARPRAAAAAPQRRDASCCGTGDADRRTRSGDAGLRRARSTTGDERRRRSRDAPSQASLGCGDPTAVADLHEGETVLDLGSGGGADVLHLRPARRPDRQGLSAST